MSASLSVLELPVGTHPDPDEFVQAAMAWHFDPSTGSPFWLERARSLEFEPRSDVKSFEDLSLFPNVTDELRDVPVRDLIPKGFGDHPEVVGVIESGGTTGPPKRLPLLREFSDRLTAMAIAQFERSGVSRERGELLCLPGGPHGAFEQHKRAATAWGMLVFGIDIDPRWVKKCIGQGKREEADAYAEHLVDQAAFVLRSQDIGRLSCTPPVLVRIARRDDLVEIINERVDLISWGGASMDADTRFLCRTEVFPNVILTGGYGTAMALGAGGGERPGLAPGDPWICDPSLSPHVTFSVVDPDTMRPVAYGERGQLVVNHLSKSFLLPNNLERDLATRVQPIGEQVGDSIGDIAPVADFKGAEVIEGVY